MAAFAGNSQEGSPRNKQSETSTFHRVNEEYITQLSEEKEGRRQRNYLQNLVGQIARFWLLCLNVGSFLRFHKSGSSPELFPKLRGHELRKHEPNGDRSWKDPHPEVDAPVNQVTQPVESDGEETS